MRSILIILTLSISLFGNAQKAEPPFWWADMEEPELEIMIYAPHIANNDVSLAASDISLLGAYKTSNPNYLFVSLNISKAKAQNFEIILTNNGETIKIPYELKQRESDSKNRIGFNSTDAMYLITPDRFANGDNSNDNITGYTDKLDRINDYGRHGGDLAGISQHIDYLSDMGFTAIWLSPVLENNMPKASYHGYAITDFYKVDPRFGTNEEYIDLIKKANAKGVKVIMDQILNHCGKFHWWMSDLPDSTWISGTNKNHVKTNHRHSLSLDPYASKSDYEKFKEGWFVDDMPDMNLANSHVLKYLTQNSIWWIEYSGISGIRMDTYPYSDLESLDKWSCDIMNEYPNLNIVGEEWTTNPVLTSYWQQGSLVGNHRSCLPSVMDFPLQDAIAKSLQGNNGSNSELNNIYDQLSNDVLYRNTNNLVIFGDNHDMDRFYTQVGKDLNKFKMGMGILYTMRGIPQVYYGTEALFANEKRGDHGEIRKEFDGGWDDHSINIFENKGLTPDQKEAKDFIQSLGKFRKNSTAIHKGKLLHFAPQNNVYVFFRYTSTEVVMVAINKTDKEIKLDLNQYNEVLEDKVSLKGFTASTFNKKPSFIRIDANEIGIYSLK